MNYREALIETLADLEEAKVPHDLREIAFKKGLEHRLGVPASTRPLVPDAAPAIQRTDVPTLPAAADPPVLKGRPIDALATRLGLPAEDLAEVFNYTDEGPELIIGTKKLSPGNAAATKQIAVLIAAARQATGEEWTPFGPIRDACQQYGRLDSANFASTMRELEDVFGFRSPSARKREVRLNRPGWERATAIASQLISGS